MNASGDSSIDDPTQEWPVTSGECFPYSTRKPDSPDRGCIFVIEANAQENLETMSSLVLAGVEDTFGLLVACKYCEEEVSIGNLSIHEVSSHLHLFL